MAELTLRSCDRASWQYVHVTVHRDHKFMWPCIMTTCSCDRASWQYVHVTVLHRNKFLYNKTNQIHQFPRFTPAWNSTCFGQFLCPSSGVYSLYTRHWYMSYRFEDSFRAVSSWSCSKAVYKPVPVPSVQWINSWWWAGELPETCRVSCRSKFGKLVHLVGFITKAELNSVFPNSTCTVPPTELSEDFIKIPSLVGTGCVSAHEQTQRSVSIL
jgi:hypothetical protein